MRWLVLLVLMGCSSTTEPKCTERSMTQDVIFASPLVEVQRGIINLRRMEGWKCNGETLYNAFGKSFGTRYTCTICD